MRLRVRRANDYPGEKPRRKPSGERSLMTEEILGDPSRRRCHHGNPLYQSPRATYASSSSSSRSSNSSVFVWADVYATCTRHVAYRKHAPYTCNENSLEREIFEVANLFSRLILQRTFFVWYVVTLRDDEVLTHLRLIGII